MEIKFDYSEFLQSERSVCETRYDSKQVIGMTKQSRSLQQQVKKREREIGSSGKRTEEAKRLKSLVYPFD